MAQMLDQNVLTSYRITGGKHYATIQLHFRVTDMADQAAGISHNGTRLYRSKPPSAIARDKKRMELWNSKQEEQNCEQSESQQSGDINHSGLENIANSEDNGVITVSHICTQTDERSLLAPELHNVEDHAIDRNSNLTHDPVNESKHHDVNIRPCAQYSDSEDTISDVTDVSHTDYVSMDLPILCESCNKECKTDSLWKCTRCICDICTDCVKNGKHGNHITQLHKFTIPANSDSYCDGCGFQFKTRQALYFMCTSCDNYALCQTCYKENLHSHHQFKRRIKGQVT